MATGQIIDVTTQNESLALLIALYALRKTPIIQSRAMAVSPQLQTQLLSSNNNGLIPHSLAIPHLAPLAAGSSVISDDPSQQITFDKVKGGKSVVYASLRSKAVAATTLAQHFGGYAVSDFVASQLQDFWSKELEQFALSALLGIKAYNATATDAYHDQNSMIQDVSDTPYEKGITNFCYETYLRAKATILGEQGSNIACLIVHPVVAAGMGILNANQQQINILPGSNPGSMINGVNPIPLYFAGIPVFTSEHLPSSGGVYTSIMLGEGALVGGMTPFAKPNLPALVVHAEQAAANGGGVINVHSRHALVAHPVGFDFVPPVGMLDGGPSSAQYLAATAWRQSAEYEQKRINIGYLVTREY